MVYADGKGTKAIRKSYRKHIKIGDSTIFLQMDSTTFHTIYNFDILWND